MNPPVNVFRFVTQNSLFNAFFLAVGFPIVAYRQTKTYKDVVLYPDDVAASQIGRRQRWNVQLLVSPVVRLTGLDFASVQ